MLCSGVSLEHSSVSDSWWIKQDISENEVFKISIVHAYKDTLSYWLIYIFETLKINFCIFIIKILGTF